MHYDHAGKLLLRLTVGGLMLPHGISKLVNGLGGLSGWLQSLGWPGFMAYGTILGEFVAPIFLIIGLYTRPAAIVVAINMLFAFWIAHLPHLTQLGDTGGWRVELQAFFLLGAVIILLQGAGRFSVGGHNGRYN